MNEPANIPPDEMARVLADLTERQGEAILCAASGATQRACALKMGVALATYQRHLEAARITLQASSLNLT
jgi:predicted DNA-binding protein (UPF0251 family)